MKKHILGILGGMGPLATAQAYERIIKHTVATKDQDHLDIIIINHASIIDRTFAINNNQLDVLLEDLKKDIKILEDSNVNTIAIPCNTCHTVIDQIQELTNIPIINMVLEVVKEINNNQNKYKKVGIMATDGTINSKMYQKYFDNYNLELIVPNEENQKEIMSIIYDEVKKNNYYNELHFEQILDYFKKEGCSHVILGCTELSFFKNKYKNETIDPMDYLVKASIINCGGRYKEND